MRVFDVDSPSNREAISVSDVWKNPALENALGQHRIASRLFANFVISLLRVRDTGWTQYLTRG